MKLTRILEWIPIIGFVYIGFIVQMEAEVFERKWTSILNAVWLGLTLIPGIIAIVYLIMK